MVWQSVWSSSPDLPASISHHGTGVDITPDGEANIKEPTPYPPRRQLAKCSRAAAQVAANTDSLSCDEEHMK